MSADIRDRNETKNSVDRVAIETKAIDVVESILFDGGHAHSIIEFFKDLENIKV